jgi:hypothetical protein
VQWGSAGIDEAKALAVDAAGNAYVAGNTTGDVDGANLGLEDALLSKITAAHAIDWTAQWGTDRSDRVNGVALIAGEVVVVGNTTGDLGRTNPSSDALDADAFATRISASGEIEWTTQWGAEPHDVALGVAVNDDAIYVVGATAGDIDMGDPEGALDAFCSKLNANGDVEWTVQWGSTGDDYARAIAVLASGNVVIAGSARGVLAGEGSGAMFVTEIDPDGVQQWTYKLGAHAMDTAHAIAVGGDGSIYVAGETMGELVAGAHEGKSDAFVSQRAADGSELRTQQVGTAENDIAYTVARAPGTVCFGGKTSGSFEGFTNAGGWPDNFVVTLEEP